MSVQQIDDFRAEARELAALLEPLTETDWDAQTTFKSWTINDVIQHLFFADYMALLSATDLDAYTNLRADVTAARQGGSSVLQLTRERVGHIRDQRLLEVWRDHWTALCDALADMDPDTRLKWIGPDMGLRMFATARQMETWAHGQAIYDVLGKHRTNNDRIRNVAVMGVRTYGWTFANRGQEPPGPPPYVQLTAPSGALWDFNEPSATERIQGPAVDFCQVVTQVRNIEDVQLNVIGDAARQWMAIAQCFAGPPENPPAPGTRVAAGAAGG